MLLPLLILTVENSKVKQHLNWERNMPWKLRSLLIKHTKMEERYL